MTLSIRTPGPMVEDNEIVVRAFHGATFGYPNDSTFPQVWKSQLKAYHRRYPEVVELAQGGFLKLYSTQLYLLTKERKMVTTTQPVKMVRPEDLPKASYCTAVPPVEFPQFTRGMLRWLREQARQAEEDPNRGWDGAKPEYIKLFTRTHPDPHPEKSYTVQKQPAMTPTNYPTSGPKYSSSTTSPDSTSAPNTKPKGSATQS